MSIKAGAFAVGTTATKLWPTGPAAFMGGSLVFINTGTVEVRLGDASVTPTTGLPIAPGKDFAMSFKPTEELYVVAASNTTISILSGGAA